MIDDYFILYYLGRRKGEMINLIVVDLHHSHRNNFFFINFYHSGVDMQHSVTYALVGAHQRAII